MYCETYADGSWYCSYDDGSEQVGYASGETVYDSASDGGFDWNAFAQSGIQAATTVLAGRGYSVTPRYPTNTYSGAVPGVSASAGANRSGIGTSLNISTNTLMLIAGGVLLFMLGSKRGR